MHAKRTQDHEPNRSVKLTGQDIADAKRLLFLLTASAERQASILPPPQVTPEQPVSRLTEKAREILLNRRRRLRFFDEGMFSESAWELLLQLYALDSGARQTISRLADLSGTSKSTAVRWLAYLEKHDLARRVAHPTDKRSHFVQLTENGKKSIEAYLSETITIGDS